ncbi:hypothetical protein UK23_06840 [Lentzea aerocolonigenes]|uniref:Uncharacterized protein n=1 Tax=Lentzea aerocolonigenes TaxID=68170 RepID=A0A0F0HAU4_LENAE|nr:hypothetical protein [Lentzea aerocolonigenes]KJK51437.1 hypothetical protein UK23_06840 [Lentzea aerocolonigenes]
MKRPGLGTGWIVGITIATTLLLVAAATTTFLLINNREAGAYGQKPLPSCENVFTRVKGLPPLTSEEGTATGRKCHFTDAASGKSAVFESSVSTVDEQRAQFQRYLDDGYVRKTDDGMSNGDAAWQRATGDDTFCSLVVLDSNGTFRIDYRDPGLSGTPNVEPEWLCHTKVRLLWLDFFLVARGS